MCINPARLPDGTTFGCRKCWQCIENSVQNWMGRCIAESKMATKTYSVTYTYGGGDHERATVLTYSDVQKYFKRLRKAGYVFRYLVAGEYGEKKGRTHWHAMMFFYGRVPQVETYTIYHGHTQWGHGHTMWKDPDPKHVRYVCKYLQKDMADDERQALFRMSKRPPLGSEYFRQMARQIADDGLAPQDLIYRFDENRAKNGKMVKHMMSGACAEIFLYEYCRYWAETRGDEFMPNSPLVEEYLDRWAMYAPPPKMETRQVQPRPTYGPKLDTELKVGESLNTWTAECNGVRYYWRPADAADMKGEWLWRGEDGHEIRWEQSERYKHLCDQSARRKAQQESTRQTPRSVGEIRSSDREQSRRNLRRPFMRGDD